MGKEEYNEWINGEFQYINGNGNYLKSLNRIRINKMIKREQI